MEYACIYKKKQREYYTSIKSERKEIQIAPLLKHNNNLYVLNLRWTSSELFQEPQESSDTTWYWYAKRPNQKLQPRTPNQKKRNPEALDLMQIQAAMVNIDSQFREPFDRPEDLY